MPTRRLAAVLFADIVGYTAMMQQNEAEGMAKAQRFREELPQLVLAHQGEVIEIRGDGALCLFNSAAEATTCAQQIHAELGADIPLRIGIHLGDVMQHSDHIMGDAVNIASRIESMGVAGAVLLSSSIRQQIKNKPEFELISLGKFAFKNVAEPMTVYALGNAGMVVPKAEQMKGKGDQVGLSSKRIVQLASVGFMAMALGAMIFWAGGFMGAEEGQLSDSIKAERVAAIPFKNLTGDDDLDAFGALCSDLITNGLTEAGIKTCSPRTIQQYSHLIGILPNHHPEGKKSFSEVVGARYWIDGSFLKKSKQLVIKSQLIDGYTGEVVRTFPEIAGQEHEKEILSDSLTRRIMGFWLAKEEIEKGKIKPPLYEAYKEYRKGMYMLDGSEDHRSLERRHSRKAFEMDSTFYLAAIREAFWTWNSGRKDSIFSYLERKYDLMSDYEQKLFRVCKVWHSPRKEGYSQAMGDVLAIFPKDLFMIEHLSYHLAHSENQPNRAWELSHTMDLQEIPSKLIDWRMWQVLLRADFGIMTGKYDEVLDELETFVKPVDKPFAKGSYFFYSVLALVRSGQIEKLDQLLQEAQNETSLSTFVYPSLSFIDLCNRVGNDLLVLGDKEKAYEYLNSAVEWALADSSRLESLYDSLGLAESYRLLGKPEQALPLELPYVEAYTIAPYNQTPYWGWVTGNYLSGIGIDYALIGNDSAAKNIGELLKKINSLGIYAARVFVALDEKDEAVKCLQAGMALYSNDGFGFKYDYFMQNMNGYQPYEEFVRIRD